MPEKNKFIYKKKLIEQKVKFGKAKQPKPIKKNEETCIFPNIISSPQHYNTPIPKKVYMTWNTKLLPSKMNEYVELMKTQNEDYEFHIYDDDDCIEFLKTNFPPIILQTYISLLPGAYKADLWRYAILFTYGGIYIDIKFVSLNGFRFDSLFKQNKEYFVLDQPYFAQESIASDLKFINDPLFRVKYQSRNYWKDKPAIYNAFMICRAGNPYLKKAMDAIVENVKNKRYTHHFLYISGPGLLGDIYFKDNYLQKLKNIELYLSRDGKHILTKKEAILKIYEEYRQEQHEKGTPHYFNLWKQRKVFRS